jgi:hypothetical protein
MKKNNFKVLSFSKQVLLVLAALVICPQCVIVADDNCNKFGFWDTKDNGYVWQVNFGYNNGDWTQHGDRVGNYSGNLNIGLLKTDLKINWYNGQVFGGKGGGKGERYLKIGYRYNVNGGSYTDFSYPDDLSHMDNTDGCGDYFIQAGNVNYTLVDYETTDPGSYNYQYLMRLALDSYDGMSSDGKDYCHGGSNTDNMHVNFVRPGIIAASKEFGEVVKGKTSRQAYNFKMYGFKSCTLTIEAGTPFTFDGGGKTYTVSNASTNGNKTVYITYTPTINSGNETASLTFSGKLSDDTDFTKVTGDTKFPVDIELIGTGASSTTPVIFAGAAPVELDGPRVKLSGYLKSTGCSKDFTTYGFFYIKKTGHVCGDVTGSGASHIEQTGPALSADPTELRDWNQTIYSGLETNTEYFYKPYMLSAGGTKVYSASCYTFTTKGLCNFPQGDEINYYIDESLEENDPCELRFTNIEDALKDLKTHVGSNYDDWWDASNNLLKANIVFNVAPGKYGIKGGIMDFSDINTYRANVIPTKRFTIQGTEADNKPVVYGMNLAKSRWVTAKNLVIERATKGTGLTESVVIVGFADATNDRAVGLMEECGLEFIDCDIVADAFTCFHANGLNGLYMTGCNLNAQRTEDIADNDRNWGASIKFMNSKNIKLVRNNFRGSHANNIFFQNSQNALIMNNAFWNDNKITYSSTTNSPSFIRLVNYKANNADHKITGVGIYYNTFYLADSDASGESSKKFDFLVFSGTKQIAEDGDFYGDRYDVANIHFQYNNCYSYSDDISGGTSDAFHSKSIDGTFKYNNFWAAKDGADFSFGANKLNPAANMGLDGGQVCKTAPFDPDQLVIKGTALNYGSKITSDASGLGADQIYDDRLHDDIRPASGTGWSYGAYQTSPSSIVETIYWKGTVIRDGSTVVTNSDWDNRNNWYKKVNGKNVPVSCADILSENLTVIIEEQTTDTPVYPVIPEWGDDDRYTNFGDEGVFAGKTLSGSSKFARTIDLRYGAALIGVENLKDDGVYRYFDSYYNFTGARKTWTIVGTVLEPFVKKNPTEEDCEVRLMTSGEYFKDFEPHVYMQKFSYDGTSIKWNVPFTSKETPVAANESFAIFIADQYGPQKFTAKVYYKDVNSTAGDEPVSYRWRGRFAAAEMFNGSKPSYTFDNGSYYFVNNLYPANLKLTKFNTSNDLQYFDYGKGAWVAISPSNLSTTEIRPQGGFFVKAKSNNTVTLEASDFTSNNTRYKSADVITGMSLYAFNTATNKGSVVGAWQNYKNISKVENGSDSDVCELYVKGIEDNYSIVTFNEADTVLALGIHNKSLKNMTVMFELEENFGMETVILEDRGVEPVVRYDLTSGQKPYIQGIPSGYTDGRFYLILGDGHSQEQGDITTVDYIAESENKIDIFANKGVITVSASENVILQKIYVYDMAGRVQEFEPESGRFSVLKLNVDKGAYVIRVVGDNMTTQQKIVLN